MALSIKTDEADRLARELSRLTGETMTQAVTVALRERLERAQARPKTEAEIDAKVAVIQKLTARMRASMTDTSPVTKAEFDALWEDGPADEGETVARRRARR